ncbi:MAG: HupE/UreJ family protein [Gemmatimonadales bacterium]
MSELASYAGLGIRHILAPDALDHLLFLLVLVAPYRAAQWRHLLVVASAFTVGHSITLALAAGGVLWLPTSLIEFLIPLTIVITGLANVRRLGRVPGGREAPLLAAGFGLIHGAGFANVLRDLLGAPAAAPLLGFNLGVELGQIVVLAAALLLLTGLDRVLVRMRPLAPVRLRTGVTSVAAAAGAAFMAAGRLPW